VETSNRVVDLLAENVDIAIRAGQGDWPGLIAEHLMFIDLVPMASPQLLASVGGVTTPADLLKLPLLREDIAGLWEAWFAEQGVEVEHGVARGGMLETQLMIARAVVGGMGVGLLHPAFFPDEFAAGQLVQPFQAPLRSRRAYFLAYPKVRRHHPRVKAFRDWLMAEIAAQAPDAERLAT
jgi:LysR family glycine cleavage system transcriptional activator